jgi:hypothetical protein
MFVSWRSRGPHGDSTYRELWILDCKLLELGQELLTALWRKDRVEDRHGFGSHGVGEAFDGAHDTRHDGKRVRDRGIR